MTSDTVVIAEGIVVSRIQALVDFSDVKAGDVGGFIEGEKNLAHDGTAWVAENARVYGNAKVSGDARVYGDAWVFDNAWVFGNASVYENARVYGDAKEETNMMEKSYRGIGEDRGNVTGGKLRQVWVTAWYPTYDEALAAAALSTEYEYSKEPAVMVVSREEE